VLGLNELKLFALNPVAEHISAPPENVTPDITILPKQSFDIEE